MELEEVQTVDSEIHHIVRRTGRRRRTAVEIGRKQPTHQGALLEADLSGRGASKHGGAIVGAGLGAYKGVAIKHVEGFVVCVGPNAHFRIVVEIVVLEAVAVESAGSVGG